MVSSNGGPIIPTIPSSTGRLALISAARGVGDKGPNGKISGGVLAMPSCWSFRPFRELGSELRSLFPADGTGRSSWRGQNREGEGFVSDGPSFLGNWYPWLASPYLLTHDEPDGTVRDEEGVPNPSFQLTRPTEP
jgi:hypothetical protein